MQVSLGYVLSYNANSSTVTIRTMDGTTLPDVPYDANLAFFGTPVPSRIETIDGKKQLVKQGSTVQFFRLADNTLRIIRVFNDDQDMVVNTSGQAVRTERRVQDSLVSLVQSGEALMSAPGVIEKFGEKDYRRVPGAWALAKNNGDYIISNGDSSNEIFMSHTGDMEFTGVTYSIRGSNTTIQETETGVLNIQSTGTESSALTFNPNGDTTWSTRSSEISMGPATLSMSTGEMDIAASSSLNIRVPQISVSGFAAEIGVDSLSVQAATSASLTTGDLAVTASGNSTTAVTGKESVTAGTAEINIAGSALQITEAGAALTLPDDAKLSINLKDWIIEASADGVKITTPSGKFVDITKEGDTGATLLPVLLGEPTPPAIAAQTKSTVLRASMMA